MTPGQHGAARTGPDTTRHDTTRHDGAGVFFSFFRFAFFIFPDFSAISHFSCPRFHFAFSCPRFHFAFSCPRFHFAFFLHSRRWRPPVIARRGKCRVSSLGVLGRVGERGHPGGRRQREQRRAGVHARSQHMHVGRGRGGGGFGLLAGGEHRKALASMTTPFRSSAHTAYQLIFSANGCARAAGRMSPSPSSSSPVVLRRRRRRRRPRRRHRRRPCRPRFRNLHRQQQQQPQQQQQRVESHHQFTFRGGWEGAGWEERRTSLE